MDRQILLFLGATIISTSCADKDVEMQGPNRSQLPNIVFYLADDMGIGDIGCYGQEKIETPNIDRLAEEGLRFTHHYSGSTVSAPSRCCLMTGKHTGHAYIRGNKGVDLPAEEITVAELLETKGYATGAFGKWGLGLEGTTGSAVRQGFDEFYGYLNQGAAHRYYPEYLIHNEEKEILNQEYSHFKIMERGLQFIEKNAGQPFFAFFTVTLPHADLDYPDISYYDAKFQEEINTTHSDGYKYQPKPKATYASMVGEMDRNIGQIVELLKSKGILDNTIIIFTSDNGVHDKGGHDPDFFNSNSCFRGMKRDLYEGGVRAPFVVYWPSVIHGGRTTEHISTFWDFLPTVADITGCTLPEGIDGISYLPVLKGNEAGQRQHEYIYFEFYEKGNSQSILKDGWKLLRLQTSKPDKCHEELYYLPDDIGEERNLIGDHPEKASELRRLAETAHTDSKEFN